ncbi:VRR-NUC domain-containing protein [Gemmiger formicilis]|uniref:VRR-NUC domain-containing protein n=1 Tax=Gemmiger formicilis TaxID=745368 RepID=UPI003CCB6AAC
MIRRNANGATSEDTEQIHVMQWAEITANRGGAFEKLRLLFHIPNGGARSKAEGAIFKAMGVKSGVPDLFLPVPMELVRDDGYSAMSSGLFIEMKAHGGRVQPNQSGRCVMKEGVAVYVHPEGRFAVVELEFPGGLWQKTVKLRETHWMEEIRRKG